MKNNECIIYLVTKKGWKQTYKKEKDYWIQETNGIIRKMTPEQLLSHILPVIAWNKNGIDYRQGSKLIVKRKVK
ncbi:MAG TPA: hypothetical protein VMC80_00035 [Patescibacteria group bacterium]|nr:hypothetical protein [Patescibacteria group bacterium]